MNTTYIGYTHHNEHKGKSGSDNYKNPTAQKVHEKIGVPYQAVTPQQLLHAMQDTHEGLIVVELQTGEFLYGFVSYPEQIPSKQLLRAVRTYVGVADAQYYPKAGA
jgi:hypothetical protein